MKTIFFKDKLNLPQENIVSRLARSLGKVCSYLWKRKVKVRNKIQYERINNPISFLMVFTSDGAVNSKLFDCAYTVTVLSHLELGVVLLWGKRRPKEVQICLHSQAKKCG